MISNIAWCVFTSSIKKAECTESVISRDNNDFSQSCNITSIVKLSENRANCECSTMNPKHYWKFTLSLNVFWLPNVKKQTVFTHIFYSPFIWNIVLNDLHA